MTGHTLHWKDTEADQLRRERDRLKQQQARLEDEKREALAAADAQRERAEKAERATKRFKKRSSAGTCPCCSRTFSNMAEHMKHQHPEFVADGGAKVVPIKRARGCDVSDISKMTPNAETVAALIECEVQPWIDYADKLEQFLELVCGQSKDWLMKAHAKQGLSLVRPGSTHNAEEL